MRRTAAALLSPSLAAGAVLTLMLGAVACTGGDEDAPAETTTPAPATPADGSHPGGSSDAGGSEDAPLDEQDLEAASARFVEALRVLDDRDWESACGYVMDPGTGTAPVGERLQECTDGVEEGLAGHEDLFRPGTFDSLDPSLVTAHEQADGTVRLTVGEEELDIPMVRGTDGEWYLSIPF